jgi:tetratricopeptide (TPR) repeat protein
MNKFLVALVISLSVYYLSPAGVSAQTAGDPTRNGRSNARDDLTQAAQLENQAAKLLYSEGDYDQALSYYKQALQIRESISGSDSAELAPTLMEIALCYRARGDYASAEEAYKRSLALREKALGQIHQEVGKTLQRYACLMRRIGRKEEADHLSARAGAIIFKSLHKPGPINGTVINGTRLSTPKPSYPKYVGKQKISGTVIVQVLIGEDGNVLDACAIDGPPSLAQVSEAAGLRAKFTPTTLGGIAVRVYGLISYDFKQ